MILDDNITRDVLLNRHEYLSNLDKLHLSETFHGQNVLLQSGKEGKLNEYKNKLIVNNIFLFTIFKEVPHTKRKWLTVTLLYTILLRFIWESLHWKIDVWCWRMYGYQLIYVSIFYHSCNIKGEFLFVCLLSFQISSKLTRYWIQRYLQKKGDSLFVLLLSKQLNE